MSLPLDDPRPRPNEREGLVDFLEYQRQVLRRKVDGLSAENLGRTAAASSLTLGGLIRHLTFVENLWFLDRVAGEGMPAPWTDVDWKADPTGTSTAPQTFRPLTSSQDSRRRARPRARCSRASTTSTLR